jgi:RHS repeat-associated protein
VGKTFYYYLTDQVGSVLQVIREDGAVMNRYDYDAFGKAVAAHTSETVENRYRFQGREYDAHRGDYYFRNRTYVPEWGCFTGPDALVKLEPNGPCNYLFAENNPLRYVDPEGLDGEQEMERRKRLKEGSDKSMFVTCSPHICPAGITDWEAELVTKTERGALRAVHEHVKYDQGIDRPANKPYRYDVHLDAGERTWVSQRGDETCASGVRWVERPEKYVRIRHFVAYPQWKDLEDVEKGQVCPDLRPGAEPPFVVEAYREDPILRILHTIPTIKPRSPSARSISISGNADGASG